MTILDSPLLHEFVGLLRVNWGASSRVKRNRRRLRQLVAMVRGVADVAEDHSELRGGSLNAWLQLLRQEALRGQAVLNATSDVSAVVGSARKFLDGIKTLFVCSAEVNRLTEAVEELERLAGPGGDLHLFVQTLQLDTSPAAAAAMEVDAAPVSAATFQQGSSCAGAFATDPPVRVMKRKHEESSGSGQAGESTSHGAMLDRAGPQKRRALSWMRLPSFDGVFTASRGPPARPRSRSDRARTVAMAMARVRRRIGKPTMRHRRPGLPSLGRRLSRIAL